MKIFRKDLPEEFTAKDVYHFMAELSHHAHLGQKYGEKPYTYHLEDVEATFLRLLDLTKIMAVRDSLGFDQYSVSDMVLFLRAACLGHDIIEDTDVTADYLREKRLPEFFIQIIVAVTKVKGMSQPQYLSIVKANPLAVLVKTPDSLSNLQHSIQSGWIKGITKYTRVLRFLNGDGKLIS
jgi:hypothetical protein